MLRFIRFGTVGLIGFIVDAGGLLLFVVSFAWAPLISRVLSFVSAATVTFLLNHRFTFQLEHKFSLRRWSYYLIATGVGAAINVSVYRGWIHFHGIDPLNLVIGTAIGSLCAMSLNYLVSSRLVFRVAK